MDNVPVSRYQFKENLLLHPEKKVAIFIEFTSEKSQQPATLRFFALVLVEHRPDHNFQLFPSLLTRSAQTRK